MAKDVPCNSSKNYFKVVWQFENQIKLTCFVFLFVYWLLLPLLLMLMWQLKNHIKVIQQSVKTRVKAI